MKRKLALGIALAIAVLLFMTTCDLSFKLSAPDFSLDVSAQTVYNSPDNVLIQFSFTGEEDTHLCHYTISKNGGTSFSVIEEGEEELLSGQVYDRTFDISTYGDGHYRFSFAVLLARNGDYDSPSFLQESLDFWIDPSGPSGLVTISPDGGSYNSVQPVVLDHPEIDTIDGSPARIFYTTDGSDPTTSSEQYDPGNPVVVSTNTTLKAIAIDMADRSSGISTATYEIDIQAPEQPAASLVSGTYGTNTVDLSHPEYPTSTGGTPVSLYYTLNGPTPDASSSEYTGTAITLPEGSAKLRAVAIDAVGNTSAELVRDYFIDTVAPGTPSLGHSTGEYFASFDLAISHAEIPTPSGTDVQIFYTIDGSIPDRSANPYDGPIKIPNNTEIKAIAIDQVDNASSVVTEIYTFLRVDSINPASCTIDSSFHFFDIYGFFGICSDSSGDYISESAKVYLTQGALQVECVIVDVASIESNLVIQIDGQDLIDKSMAAEAATITVVSNVNSDSGSVAFSLTDP